MGSFIDWHTLKQDFSMPGQLSSETSLSSSSNMPAYSFCSSSPSIELSEIWLIIYASLGGSSSVLPHLMQSLLSSKNSSWSFASLCLLDFSCLGLRRVNILSISVRKLAILTSRKIEMQEAMKMVAQKQYMMTFMVVGSCALHSMPSKISLVRLMILWKEGQLLRVNAREELGGRARFWEKSNRLVVEVSTEMFMQPNCSWQGIGCSFPRSKLLKQSVQNQWLECLSSSEISSSSWSASMPNWSTFSLLALTRQCKQQLWQLIVKYLQYSQTCTYSCSFCCLLSQVEKLTAMKQMFCRTRTKMAKNMSETEKNFKLLLLGFSSSIFFIVILGLQGFSSTQNSLSTPPDKRALASRDTRSSWLMMPVLARWPSKTLISRMFLCASMTEMRTSQNLSGTPLFLQALGQMQQLNSESVLPMSFSRVPVSSSSMSLNRSSEFSDLVAILPSRVFLSIQYFYRKSLLYPSIKLVSMSQTMKQESPNSKDPNWYRNRYPRHASISTQHVRVLRVTVRLAHINGRTNGISTLVLLLSFISVRTLRQNPNGMMCWIGSLFHSSLLQPRSVESLREILSIFSWLSWMKSDITLGSSCTLATVSFLLRMRRQSDSKSSLSRGASEMPSRTARSFLSFSKLVWILLMIFSIWENSRRLMQAQNPEMRSICSRASRQNSMLSRSISKVVSGFRIALSPSFFIHISCTFSLIFTSSYLLLMLFLLCLASSSCMSSSSPYRSLPTIRWHFTIQVPFSRVGSSRYCLRIISLTNCIQSACSHSGSFLWLSSFSYSLIYPWFLHSWMKSVAIFCRCSTSSKLDSLSSLCSTYLQRAVILGRSWTLNSATTPPMTAVTTIIDSRLMQLMVEGEESSRISMSSHPSTATICRCRILRRLRPQISMPSMLSSLKQQQIEVPIAQNRVTVSSPLILELQMAGSTLKKTPWNRTRELMMMCGRIVSKDMGTAHAYLMLWGWSSVASSRNSLVKNVMVRGSINSETRMRQMLRLMRRSILERWRSMHPKGALRLAQMMKESSNPNEMNSCRMMTVLTIAFPFKIEPTRRMAIEMGEPLSRWRGWLRKMKMRRENWMGRMRNQRKTSLCSCCLSCRTYMMEMSSRRSSIICSIEFQTLKHPSHSHKYNIANIANKMQAVPSLASYFHQTPHPTATAAAISKSLLSTVQDKITTELAHDHLQLPPSCGTTSFHFPKEEEQGSPKIEDMLHEVEEEKRQVKLRALELQQKQHELKHQTNFLAQKQKVSRLTANDRQNLKQLLLAGRLKEREFKRKEKLLFEGIQEVSLEEAKSEHESIEKSREKRKIAAMENLQSLQLRRTDRQKMHIKSQQMIKSIYNRRYLHEANQKMDLLMELEKSKEYDKKLTEFKESVRFDFNEIQEHQKKYDELLQEQRKKNENATLKNSFSNRSFGHNYFSMMTKMRMEEEKSEQIQRSMQAKQMKQKISQYQQQVYKTFKPKVTEKSKFTPFKNSVSAQALRDSERRQKGIKYLQMAKKMRSDKKGVVSKEKKGESPARSKSEYKDYTKEIKLKPNNVEQQFYKLVGSKERAVSDFESADKAVKLAELMEIKSKKKKDQKLFVSIQNKLQILQAIQSG